ncbi:FBD-like domain family protein [Hirschfeldia incana]|nr:FBD-like domain family protein [Hirschfeldia incana]
MLLSKRWKFIWTMVPTLAFHNGFESSKDDYARFRQHVCLFMALHKSPVLETLKLRLGWYSTTDDITTWIRIAMARYSVRKLKIHRCRNDDDDFILPRCIYTYAKLKVQHRIEFNQLVHLELCSSVEKWCELLNWMLESSPKLKILKLNKCKPHRFVYAKEIEFPWGKPSSVHESLMFHLNTFEWNYYNGCREEKKMVAYILRHAKLLKTAKISMWDLDCEAEPHIFKEWRSFHRASKSCRLLSDHEPKSVWC